MQTSPNSGGLTSSKDILCESILSTQCFTGTMRCELELCQFTPDEDLVPSSWGKSGIVCYVAGFANLLEGLQTCCKISKMIRKSGL